MARVPIRDVDDETREADHRTARIKDVSLEQALRNLLEAGRPFTPDERVARAREVGLVLHPLGPTFGVENLPPPMESREPRPGRP